MQLGKLNQKILNKYKHQINHKLATITKFKNKIKIVNFFKMLAANHSFIFIYNINIIKYNNYMS